MDGAWLARVRWRRRGAWMWPAFAALTVADAVIGHQLPPAGDSETVFAAALLGCALNLVAVILLSHPLGALIRRVRGDLPRVVARDHGGTAVVVTVTIVLLAAGLAHRSSVITNRNSLRDAMVRAAAWIGDRAPVEFRRNIGSMDTVTIEAGSTYRSCVRSADRRRNYCVDVELKMPFAQSVRFAGSESNSVFAQGTG